MSDPVLSQLVSVEADLAQQAELLEAKLTQLQEQRQGLRTVINMFSDSDDSAAETVTESEPAEALPEDQPESSPDVPSPVSSKKSGAKRKSAAKSSRKTTAKSSTDKRAERSTKPKKRDGRAANWQKYVISEYRDTALPEAVSSVLRSNPSEIFTIADVMADIFGDNIPRSSYLKARNRISNILSAGARDGTWYRGRNGRYSQSESVTKLK